MIKCIFMLLLAGLLCQGADILDAIETLHTDNGRIIALLEKRHEPSTVAEVGAQYAPASVRIRRLPAPDRTHVHRAPPINDIKLDANGGDVPTMEGMQ